MELLKLEVWNDRINVDISGEFDLIKFSIIIPCRNEINYIDAMIESVFRQSIFKKHSGEVIVVDGSSDDGTVMLLNDLQKKHPNLKILYNPEKHVSTGLNLAIDSANGEYVVRMDVHAVYPEDYIMILLGYLEGHSKVDNVGVPLKTIPSGGGLKEVAIAHVMSHKLGVGGSDFRLGSKTAKEVDTVPFGCFRKNIFEKVGLFDTQLIRNQDDELNGRIVKSGGKIMLLPLPEVQYFARETYSKLRDTYFQYGMFKPLTVVKLGSPTTIRQLVPPLFVLSFSILLLTYFSSAWARSGLIIYIIIYLSASVYVAISTVKRPYYKKSGFFGIGVVWPFVLLAMIIIHFSYGLGYIVGVFKLLWKTSSWNVKQSR